MIPWIQVYSNLAQHRKTARLADELKLSCAAVDPDAVAVGILVSLWSWAIQSAYNGDLSDCSARTIANACRWKKKPETLVEALKKAGWLDEDMRLHNWDDYSVMYQELQEDKKLKHRERQRRYRERTGNGAADASPGVTGDAVVTPQSDARDADKASHCDVTVTSRGDACDAVPNLTLPNLTKDPPPPSGGVGSFAGAPAPEPAAPAAAEELPSVRDPETVAVIADYANRVNPAASPRCLAELEAFARAMGPEVCRRAIDIALDERKATWSYIRAILRDKQAKGVKSLADWEALEVKRAPAPMPDKPGEADKRARDDMEQLREIMARERALMARDREAGE